MLHIFINNTKILINYILINYRQHFFISIIIFLFFTNSLIYVTFAQTDLNNITNSHKDKPTKTTSVEDEYWFPMLKDVTVPLIIGIFGIFSAGWIVNRWQKKKDISSIRSKVLSDFQESFKDYIVMMDTFLAKILFKCYTLDNSKSVNKRKLTELLPYGYDIESDENKIDNKINDIDNLIFDFSSVQKNKFAIENDFIDFEKEFFNRRILITKFSSGLRQYYKDGDSINKEFDKLWETKIMYSHVLIHIMMRAEDEGKFIEILEKIKGCIEDAFKTIKEYDKILSEQEIEIEKKHQQKNNTKNSKS